MIAIEGYDEDVVIEKPLHADYLERGNRLLPFSHEVYIAGEDMADGVSRLMDAVNVEIKSDKVTYHSTSFEEARDVKAKIIQWVPLKENIKASVVMDDASVKTGLVENTCADLEVGDVVQFERVGFARLDSKKDDELIFYFAHR